MKNKVSSLITRATALALFASPFCTIQAQEVYSATIGAVAMKVPSESDVMVALPFKQEKKAGGNVASIDGSVATLGASSLEAGSFDAVGVSPNRSATHYLYVEDGALKGRRFDIDLNDTNSLTLLATDLTGLAGANVSVRAHWTLGTLFPEGVGYFEEVEAGLRQIEVIVPDLESEGGGLAADRIFYYYDNAWREVGEALGQSVNTAVIEPGTAFVVRNNGASDLDYYFFGEVEFGPMAIPLVSKNAAVVDNFVSVTRPLGLTINDLQLHSSGVFGAEDRLLVYPEGEGKNKSPVAYHYESGAWRLEGGDGSDVGSTMIKAGQGIAVRKADAGADSTNYWVNEWSLAQ